MTFPLLQLKNLCISFKTESGIIDALHNISFEVKPGEVVAIVGESGSGKSITSLSVLQLLPSPPAIFSKGEILFSKDGNQPRDLLRLASDEIRHIRGNEIAMIFQEPMTSLNPLYTCGEQVIETIQQHQKISRALAKQKTIELFEKVKLSNPAAMLTRYPHQLSGGQKQRVMIAMSISCNPSLLIADEPTTALDVTVQNTILMLIKELQRQYNMGVIFITHDLGIVADVANKIIVMYQGKIVEQDTVNAILQSPKHPYTKSLLACRPQLHMKGERLPVVSDFMEMNQEGEIVEKTEPGIRHSRVKVNMENSFLTDIRQAATLIEVESLKVWFPEKKILGRANEFCQSCRRRKF